MNNKAGRKKGNILTITLLVMMVGAIIMALFFQYLGASLALAIRGEENANTYYAADSGFEDGFYWLQQGKELGGFWAWNEGEEQWERENYELNDRTIQVGVEDTGDDIYKITSRAISDEGRNTVIESYIRMPKELDLTHFADYVLASNTSVNVQGNKGVVHGSVTYVDEIVCPSDPNCEESINGSIIQEPGGIDWWPETQQLIDYYSDEVDQSNPYPWDIIDVATNPTIGPLYRDGDLTIRSSVADAYLTLTGTVYVSELVSIGQSDQDFTLDLNGHTIFVEISDLPYCKKDCPEGVMTIGGKCRIVGSGAIIAIGDVLILPSVSHNSDDFIVIMSVEGSAQFQPNGDFYGSIAGAAGVNVQPNTMIKQSSGEFPLGFPGTVDPEILTYTIVD